MLRKKVLAIVMIIAMVTLTVAGCQKSSNETKKTDNTPKATDSTKPSTSADNGEKITLTWAVFETDNYTAELWQSIIDAYENDNPNVKIEKVLMTGDSRPQFLKTMLTAGNMPDINIDPVDLAKTDGIYAEVPEEMLTNYEDTAIATYNGKHTLVPAYKALRNQCYYHKDQFKEAGITAEPTTWDEFVQACEKLKAAGKTPLMGAGASDIWATSFGYWTGVANSDIVNKYPDFNKQIIDGTLKWTDSVVEDSLQKWQDLIKAGYYHKGSMSFSYTQAQQEFLKGSSAMFMDGAWAAPTLDKDGVKLDDIGVFVMPTSTGAKTYCTMPQYWGVSETCKNKEEAFKFCAYVLGGNKEVYAKYLKADGTYSVTKEPVVYDMGPIQKEFLENYNDVKLVPEIMKVVGDTAMPSGFEDYTCKSLQNIFTGASVKDELGNWDKEMQKLLQSAK